MEKEFSQFMNPIFNLPSFFGMGMFPQFADGRSNFFQNHPNAQQEGAQQNQQNQQYQQSQQRSHNQRSNQKDRFSFSQQEKDYNIKDIWSLDNLIIFTLKYNDISSDEGLVY